MTIMELMIRLYGRGSSPGRAALAFYVMPQ